MKVLLSCKDVLDFLDRYVAGELEPAEAKRFRWHLRLCRSCRAYLKSYETTIRLEAALDEPPEPVPEDLVVAILRSRG